MLGVGLPVVPQTEAMKAGRHHCGALVCIGQPFAAFHNFIGVM